MGLELKNVVKRVGAETHVYETSIKLAETGFNILLGATLAGKTTLMQLMAGLDRPTAGEVWLDGRDVTSRARAQAQRLDGLPAVHQLPQPHRLREHRLAAPGGAPAARRPSTSASIAWPSLLHLKPLLQRRPGELSGGQQQRTALARALVKDADLVLLDEPLANLDFKLREELRDELPKLFADRRCTVVFATTDPMDALLLGGHTAALHEGRITQFGPTAEIYRRPADLRTAMVLSNPPINTAPVVKDGDRIVLSSNGVGWSARAGMQDLPNGRYTLGVRPHCISPVRNAGGAAVEIGGRVLITELSGAESVIHFAHGELSWASQSHGVHAMQVGETATFYLDAGQCMYFDADGRLVAS